MFVQLIAQEVAAYEKQHGLRQRARRAEDEQHHQTMIELVICNLAHAVLVPPETGRIATRLEHKSKTRYDNPAVGKPFSELLYAMSELGWLDLQFLKVVRGESASIAPTAAFDNQVRGLGISLDDFGQRNGEEVIILRRVVARRSPRHGTIKRRYRVDYDDAPVPCRFRRDLRRLNEFVGKADVAFIDDGLEPAVDSNRTMLRRYFVVQGSDAPGSGLTESLSLNSTTGRCSPDWPMRNSARSLLKVTYTPSLNWKNIAPA